MRIEEQDTESLNTTCAHRGLEMPDQVDAISDDWVFYVSRSCEFGRDLQN